MIFLIQLAGFLLAITIHELAHGAVAYARGDSTPMEEGRLTLNPLHHIDIFGTVLMPFLFYLAGLPPLGYAKPVNIRAYNLDNPRQDMMLVAAAGPASNMAAAVVFSFAARAFAGLNLQAMASAAAYFVILNLYLAFFNLVPIPPLDGSRIALGFLPRSKAAAFASLERYGFIIIFALLYTGIMSRTIGKVVMICAGILL